MLIRARRYCCRYLDAHQKVDAAAGEIAATLSKIGDSLGILNDRA
jgi:hypothetical protein